MKKTKIEWCDSSWNPVTGCYHGCEYCYARRIACRFGDFSTIDGNIVKVVNANTSTPCYEIKNKVMNPYPGMFTPTFHRYRLNEPAQWTKPRNIFVCSMADLFGEWVPDSWIEEVFAACEKAPQHRYLFLTKNVERYMVHGVPLGENMWYGTTVTKREDVDRFNNLPAVCNTFISIEPLLEDIEPRKHNIMFRQVDWFIIGAETGRRKGKVAPERKWIEDIVNECDKYGKPVFMKNSLIPIVGEDNMRREFPW